jgi:hypothetical protein
MRLVVLAISVTLAFLLSIGWQPSTLAGLLIVNSGHGGIQLNPAGGVPGLDNVVGYSFKPISNHLIATAFGFWDAQQDGIPTSMLLGLWDSATDELLASALLPSGIGTRLEGEFRFVDLSSPLMLLAGREYTLGYRRGPNVAGLVQTLRGGVPIVSSEVVITQGGLRTLPSYFLPGSIRASNFPNYDVRDFADQRPDDFLGDAQPIVCVNLEFTIVPEPSNFATALLATVTLRKRKRHRDPKIA